MLDQDWIRDLLVGYKQIVVGTTQYARRNVARFLSGVRVLDNPNYVDPQSGQIVGSTDFTIVPSQQVQRVSGSASALQSAPNAIVLCDPGGGSGGGCTVLAPATVDLQDGDKITIKDDSATANNTTQKIGFTPGAGQSVEDPELYGSGTYTSSTVYIVQKSGSVTLYWNANLSRFGIQ